MFLLHFTFFFCTVVFHRLYFPKLKMGTGQTERAMCSKKYFTKKQARDLFMSSTGGQKENGKKKACDSGKVDFTV